MRVLAVDFGAKRIGLAVSDATGTLARPLTTLHVDGTLPAAVRAVRAAIAELREEEGGLDRVVVGLPLRLDGTEHEQTVRAREFAGRLREEGGLPVELQDERLTSHEAEARLAVGERDWRRRKRKLDAAAAAVILQEYLDRHAIRKVHER